MRNGRKTGFSVSVRLTGRFLLGDVIQAWQGDKSMKNGCSFEEMNTDFTKHSVFLNKKLSRNIAEEILQSGARAISPNLYTMIFGTPCKSPTALSCNIVTISFSAIVLFREDESLKMSHLHPT